MIYKRSTPKLEVSPQRRFLMSFPGEGSFWKETHMRYMVKVCFRVTATAFSARKPRLSLSEERLQGCLWGPAQDTAPSCPTGCFSQE